MSPQPSTEKQVARHLLISGRVQGVSFRHYMREHAQKTGVTGWCRNLPDGRVEAWIQGTPDQVAEMERWAHLGPSAAVVEKVEAETSPPEPDLGAFEVRR